MNEKTRERRMNSTQRITLPEKSFRVSRCCSGALQVNFLKLNLADYFSFACALTVNLCLRYCLKITHGSRYGEVVNRSQFVRICESQIFRIANKEDLSMMMMMIVIMAMALMMSTVFMELVQGSTSVLYSYLGIICLIFIS